MSRSTDLALLLVAVATLSATGCYRQNRCQRAESCNYADDDCDGRIDEGFVDDDGVYRGVDDCGACGVDCAAAFPSAEAVRCDADDPDQPICALVSCPPGFRPSGDGACTPILAVLCLPCTVDDDCELRLPGARCLPTDSGQTRCGQPCGAGIAACPSGFACEDEQCVPESGFCGCSVDTEDAELACLLDGTGDRRCVGVQRCGSDGLGECEPALDEGCNDADDDCDGSIDEDFRDDAGRYVSRLACGACDQPCVEPGPNTVATCSADGAGARCDVDCVDGFVDVDGIAANGCECERFDGGGPPPAAGGDADCDGVPDDTDDFVYVSSSGSDGNGGTLASPVRTIGRGLALGLARGRDVLVARGVYRGPVEVVGGVSLFGGYRPDFRDRDLTLFPVVLERSDEPGLPALVCEDVTVETRIEGFQVEATASNVAGRGSTAVYLDGCSDAVELAQITVFAARGADGQDGDDSTDNLSDIGLTSLAELDGRDGGGGRPGSLDGVACTSIAGGLRGRQSCRGVSVDGGSGGAAACPETGCFNGRPCGNAGCTDFTDADGVCDFDAVLEAAVPNPAPGDGRGDDPGAAGPLTYNAPTNRGTCNFCDDNPTLQRDNADGEPGGSGTDGGAGVGCAARPQFDPVSGVLAGGSGTSGEAGTDGSGGGGASAGSGFDRIGGTSGGCSDRSGGSGGGGGSGGCGAPRAEGGQGGGESVGIVVRLPSGSGAGPALTDVRVITASGGAGGDGGVGADGGRGGVGGNGGRTQFFCARAGGRGGDGGRGGAGGGGGGGCGGGSHAAVVVERGASGQAYADGLSAGLQIEETGVPGRGGRGGFSPGASGSDGAGGGGAAVLRLP